MDDTRIDRRDADFIADLYTAIARGEGPERAIASYAARFPDIRFTWQILDSSRNEYFALSPFNYDNDVFEDYPPLAHLNPFPAMGARLAAQGLVRSGDFITTADYEKTDIYNLFFRPRDELNSSWAAWVKRKGEIAALLAADIPRRYGTAERAALERSARAILPYLERAFDLMVELEAGKTRAASGGPWLEHMPAAAFLAGADLKVTQVNAAGRELADGACGIALGRRGRLTFAAPEARQAVERAVRACLSEGAPIGPFPIPALEPHRLTGLCSPLEGGDAIPILRLFTGQPRTALLLIVDAGARPKADPDVLAAALGLTPAEARIVSRLCRGADLREAAAALGIRYNTARVQMASAALRLGVRRQTEVVAMASRTLARMEGALAGGARK